MAIGIVTVTYNSERVLGEFVRSLLEQADGDFTLYVVDNQSGDGTLEVLQKEGSGDPRIRLIRSPGNLGFSDGSNLGIRQALLDGCSHVMLLNNDTVLASDFLLEMRRAAALHPIVVPKIYYHDGKTLWFAGGRISFWRGFTLIHVGQDQLDEGQYDSPGEIAAATGCCMLIAAAVFERIGLLDGRYFAYYEDLDFSLRARRASLPIWYEPRARLYHKVGSLTGGESSAFGARMGARNKMYYLRKNYGRIACAFFGGAYLMYLIAKMMGGKDSIGRFRVRFAAVVEGLRMPLPTEDAVSGKRRA